MFNWSVLGSLFADHPIDCLIYVLTVIVVILMSLILHECAHGWMAYRCGDPTAKMLGRLSLNPLRHLDPFGTLCMLLFGFGWAKPVPVNPRNFESYRRDDFMVSIAGIVTNLTLFIGCSLAAVLLNLILWNKDWLTVLGGVFEVTVTPEGLVNAFAPYSSEHVASYIANSVSFDWLKPFTSHGWLLYVQRFLLLMAEVNLCLAIFNLLPIPPLDGYHVLNDTLLKGRFNLNSQMFQISHVLLILLVMSGMLDTILRVGSEFVGGAVVRTFLMMTGQM